MAACVAAAVAAHRTADAAITPATTVGLGAVAAQNSIAIHGAIDGLSTVRIQGTPRGAFLRR